MQEYKKIGIIVADDEEFKPLADLVTRGEFSESYFLKRKILNFKTGKADVYVLSILSFVELPAVLATVSRIVTVVCLVADIITVITSGKITFFAD